MTYVDGTIAPLAGSLTLLVADGVGARAWRGEGEPGDPIGAFHSARSSTRSRCARVALGESDSGWLAQLGEMPRDATVFRFGEDQLAIVGPYWPRDDADVDPEEASELRRAVAESGGEQLGTLQVPSGRLLVAHASGDLTGAVKVSALTPPEMHAQVEQALMAKAENREKILRNMGEIRKRLEATPPERRQDVVALIERSLECTAEGACAHIAIFGGTRAIVRGDTGDVVLVVPAGSYALGLRELTFRRETLGVLRIERIRT